MSKIFVVLTLLLISFSMLTLESPASAGGPAASTPLLIKDISQGYSNIQCTLFTDKVAIFAAINDDIFNTTYPIHVDKSLADDVKAAEQENDLDSDAHFSGQSYIEYATATTTANTLLTQYGQGVFGKLIKEDDGGPAKQLAGAATQRLVQALDTLCNPLAYAPSKLVLSCHGVDHPLWLDGKDVALGSSIEDRHSESRNDGSGFSNEYVGQWKETSHVVSGGKLSLKASAVSFASSENVQGAQTTTTALTGTTMAVLLSGNNPYEGTISYSSGNREFLKHFSDQKISCIISGE